MQLIKNFINGEHRDAADGRTTAVVNPATGQQYATAPLSGEADVDADHLVFSRIPGWHKLGTVMPSYILVTASDTQTNRVHMGALCWF